MEEISATRGDEEQHGGVELEGGGSGFEGEEARVEEITLLSSNRRIRWDNIE